MNDIIAFLQKHYAIIVLCLGGLGALIKLWVDFLFNRKAKKFEAEMQQFAFENQTLFAQLHGKRVDAILEFHRHFVKTFRAFYAVVYKSSSDAELDANTAAFKAAQQELYEADWSQQLFFPKAVSEEISNCVLRLDSSLAAARLSVSFRINDDLRDAGAAQKATDANLKDLERAIASINDKFRSLLGVKDLQ